MTPCLRAQPELLQYLISIWDKDQEKFVLRDQELELEVLDVYFITRLSRRGAVPILIGTHRSGESMGMVIEWKEREYREEDE